MSETVAERIYRPRSSEGVDELVEIVGQPPEKLLTDEEKARVTTFEDGLFNISPDFANLEGNAEASELFERENIKSITEKMPAHVRYVYPEYFLSDEGRKLAEQQGQHKLATATNLDDVKSALVELNGTGFKNELAEKSVAYPQALIKKALLEGGEVPPIDRMPIVRKPEELGRRLRMLLAYKDYLREASQRLKTEPDSNEREAKQAVINIYRSYINGHLTEAYNDTYAYVHSAGDRAAADVLNNMQQYGPRVVKLYHLAQRREYLDIAERLDGVRNGKFYSEETGFTSVNPEIEAKITSQSQQEIDKSQAAFTPSEIEKLKSISLGPAEMQELFTVVLDEWGLLSSQPPEEYDENRVGRAPDEKIQAVILAAKSLAVEGVKGIIKIPDNYQRLAVMEESPYGAIAVAGHELEHVLQGANMKRSKGLHIGTEIKGRGYLTLREAGAIRRERAVLANMFGLPRGTNLTYLKAAESRMVSNNPVDTAKSFFMELRASNPDGDIQEQATLAANRSMRFYRQGGFDTQPLDYMEQNIISEAINRLPADKQEYLYSQSGISMRDYVTLYNYGLAPEPDQLKLGRSFEEIAEEWTRAKYLNGKAAK